MKVLFLCSEKDLVRERRGYADGFSSLGVEVICSGDLFYLESLIGQLKKELVGIVNLESPESIIPIDLLSYPIPCATFEFDSFTRSRLRARACRLFDFQFVCHPGFDDLFKSLGCSWPVLLPWCCDDKLADSIPEKNKKYDLGWVGRSDARFYSHRRRILSLLKENYNLNNTSRYYNWEEMYEVYRKSRIAVNISRDDFPQDANMRCFEAMGAGAMLITQLPSELEKLGYEEGRHFIGFRKEKELLGKIHFFLSKPRTLEQISQEGRTLTLEEHTYKKRAEKILDLFLTHGKEAMKRNSFRTLNPGKGILNQILQINYKDGALEKMLSNASKVKERPDLKMYWKILYLFGKKLKRTL